MNITEITEKLSSAGYCRNSCTRHDETTGYEIIDWSHRKTLTMFSIYREISGNVPYVERTDIKFDRQLQRRVPVVKTIYRVKDLLA